MINNMSISADPGQIENAARIIDTFNNSDKAAYLTGVTNQNMAFIKAYKSQRQQGLEPQVAAQNAREVIFNKTPEQREAINLQWAEYKKAHLSTYQQREALTRKLTGTGGYIFGIGSKDIPNLPAVTTMVSRAFENNYKLLGGDSEGAMELTQQNLQKAWGHTNINGKSQYVYLPLEKAAEINQNQIGVVQQQALGQFEALAKPAKDQYDQGKSDFYYEVEQRKSPQEMFAFKKQVEDDKAKLDQMYKNAKKKGIGSLTSALQSQKDYHDLNNKISEDQKQLTQWLEGAPMSVKRIHRDGQVEQFTLSVTPHVLMGVSSVNNADWIGDFEYQLINKNGFPQSPTGLTFMGNMNPIFRLNKTFAQRDAAALSVWPEHQVNIREAFNKEVKSLSTDWNKNLQEFMAAPFKPGMK
jgi:predicted DNA-binding WGR domain protein